ncbi:hypothetical protein Hanom_Chr14g01334221 [Helianthus anomalus]
MIYSLKPLFIASIYFYFLVLIFFERQIWITDGLLNYHRAISGTTRSYPSPPGIIMSIHQFRRKPNTYGKNPHCGNRTQDLLVSKSYPTPDATML